MPIAAIRYDCVMPFTDMVRQAFSFLESAGFKLEQFEPGRRVRYRSVRVIVDVEWIIRSGAGRRSTRLTRLASTVKSWFQK